MRTTLEIDDDVLAVARAVASSRGMSIGAAVSMLVRQGLESRAAAPLDVGYSPFPVMVGEPGHVVTDELVAEHRDE